MANQAVRASLTTLVVTGLIWGSAYAIPPNVVDDVFTGLEGSPVAGNVLANDAPTSGTGLQIENANLPPGMTLSPAGDVSYTHPDPYFSGVVPFDYEVRELDAVLCGAIPDPDCFRTANGTVFFAPVANLPVVAFGGASGGEDTAIPLGISISPEDPSETLEILLSGVPTGAVLSGGSPVSADTYALSLAEANSLTITPPLNFNGPLPLSLAITTTDTALDPTSTPVTVQDNANFPVIAMVTGVDDDPFATGMLPTLDTFEDTPAAVDLASAVDDVDVGDTLTFTISSVDNAAIDTATMVGSVLDVTLLPDAFANGSVTVEVSDADGGVPVILVVPVNVAEVNDAPTVVGGVAPVDVPEDSPPEVLSFTGVFDDVDIPTGDSLSLSAVQDSGDAIFDSVSMVAEELTLTFTADANGSAVVLIEATDNSGEVVPYLLNVTVQAVNDAPVVAGSLPDRNIDEDDPPEIVSLAGVFSDVDIATNGDVLSYEVDNNTNPGIFSNQSISGDELTLDLLADANGVADISIIARDSGGLPSLPVTFTITVNGVDDLPIAADDMLGDIPEDTLELRIDVLANDYLGDQPSFLAGIESVGTYDFIDLEGNLITAPQASVAIDPATNEVVFTPSGNFWGTATFEYRIEDANGDTDTAMVSFEITPVNDPPEGLQTHRYSVFEGAVLNVDLANGLLVGAYDVDPAQVDGNGDPIAPQPLSIVFETAPPPAQGTLTTTASDGTFTFLPAPGFIGETTFQYSVFDNQVRSALGDVVIEVLPLPPAATTPNPGEVSVLFNLANTPLEQSASVSPNVLVTMDDSGSMDWQVSMDMTDDNGRFVINNNGIATSNRRERVYSYLFSLNVNSYGATSGNGRVVPSQESLPAGNDYNVWQARSAAFNSIYYDPTVDYDPWTGVDNANNDLADAIPTAIRLDPLSAANTFDITQPVDYLAHSVPRWQTNGGSANINVTNFYIPRYYTAAGVRVEIRDDGTLYPGGDQRDDCSGPGNTCTYDEEIQNFANWFQYYRSRELVAKAALGNVVAELQDIRVGFETINRRSNEPIADMNEFYWEGEKQELLEEIYEVNSSGGTPLRRALDDAGQLLGCTRGDRACPALPIPEGICQQNFSLLFSDGYWNGGDPNPLMSPTAQNFDGDDSSVFDGGKFADTHSNTLADVAMYYYENDLFPAVDDGVPLATADIESVPAGTYTSSNDFIHQHMKTFTIAFGVEPDIDPLTAETALAGTTFNWPAPGSAPNAKIDDMLHAAINGRGRFLNAGQPGELQAAVGAAFREFTQAASSSSAAAFNSTSLREGTFLYRGFYDLRNRTGEMTASTVNSTTGEIATVPTWTAARMLDPSGPLSLTPAQRIIFSYDPDNRTGIQFVYNDLTPDQQLTLSENEVNYLRGERNFEEPLPGTLRERLADEGLLGDIINSSPVYVGPPRAFNRDQSPYPITDLYSEFAANVNARRQVVYVGANDGMLHGFDAETGAEVMAYVPNVIIDAGNEFSNKLTSFTSPFYLHDYFVDLSPRLNDVYMRPSTSDTKQWMTALVGGLGAGGKGYFALNVTDPGTQFADQATAAGAALWEFTDEDDTYPLDASGNPIGGSVGAITDFNGDPVKDLGYSLSLPIVTLSNEVDTDSLNEWVAIFGNGSNSTSGIATLFVLFMDKGLDGWDDAGDFVKITTGAGVPLPGEQLEGYPNALGTPTAVDRDLNGTVDLVYAGDRLGNLWRFNLEDADSGNWTATRLFTATYDDGGTDVLQPILSQPLAVKHPQQTGFLITFGTGSFIAEEDGSDTSIQSIYTIWDPLVSNPPTANANTKDTRLVEQVITNVVDDSVTPAQTRRILSNNTVAYTAETATPGVYGWYIDLDMVRATDTISGVPNTDISGQAPPDVQYPGEKAIRRFIFRDGVILTTTVLPATNATSCFGSRPGAILILDALTGGDPGEAVIDFNLDGVVDDADLLTVGGQDFSAGLVFDFTQLDGQLVDLSTLGGQGDTDFLFICGGNECISRRIRDLNDNKTGRLSWTELRAN
ncbi:MAG: PilC/PilY family type IV pilus protein [bacterium]